MVGEAVAVSSKIDELFLKFAKEAYSERVSKNRTGKDYIEPSPLPNSSRQNWRLPGWVCSPPKGQTWTAETGPLSFDIDAPYILLGSDGLPFLKTRDKQKKACFCFDGKGELYIINMDGQSKFLRVNNSDCMPMYPYKVAANDVIQLSTTELIVKHKAADVLGLALYEDDDEKPAVQKPEVKPELEVAPTNGAHRVLADLKTDSKSLPEVASSPKNVTQSNGHHHQVTPTHNLNRSGSAEQNRAPKGGSSNAVSRDGERDRKRRSRSRSWEREERDARRLLDLRKVDDKGRRRERSESPSVDVRRADRWSHSHSKDERDRERNERSPTRWGGYGRDRDDYDDRDRWRDRDEGNGYHHRDRDNRDRDRDRDRDEERETDRGRDRDRDRDRDREKKHRRERSLSPPIASTSSHQRTHSHSYQTSQSDKKRSRHDYRDDDDAPRRHSYDENRRDSSHSKSHKFSSDDHRRDPD